MAKPKLDFKKLLLERGERLGLSVAGVITLLLLLVSLLWPGKGLFSGSPEEKAKGLTEPAAFINAKLADPNNLPGEGDMPDKKSNEKLIALNMERVDPEKFRMASLVPANSTGSQGRRVPRVLSIDEAAVKLARMQIQTYIMDRKNNIYVLVGEKNSGKAGQSDRIGAMMGSRGAKGPGGGMAPPAGGAGRSMGPRGGMGGPPPSMGGGGGEEKAAKKLIPLTLEQLAKNNDVTPAEQVNPMRMAIIAASFPYKAQVEEFRSKLALRTAEEVRTEMGAFKLKDRNEILPSFYFTGVDVERRELDGDGKPISEYAPLDLLESYNPWIIQSGARFEDEDPDLKAISPVGLVMPRLRGFRPESAGKGETMGGPGGPGGPAGLGGPPPAGGRPMAPPRGGLGKNPGDGDTKGEGNVKGDGDKSKELYPPVERELPTLRKTLETLKGKSAAEVLGPPDRFRRIGDIFNPTAPPPTKDDKTDDKPMAGDAGKIDPADAAREIPDHCLVRVIDITIQPGKTYEYRLRVKMVNPNFQRRDVASPTYAKPEDLSSEWSKTPLRVQVEPELRYYAVDQKQIQALALDTKLGKYDGPNANAAFNAEKQVWLQAHRWVERVTIRTNTHEVGEWAVAERFTATRGEYVGRPIRVQLPVWNTEREEFLIANDFSKRTKGASVEVDFGYAAPDPAQPEAIAVDFRSGKQAIDKVVKRTEEGEAAATAKVVDESAAEVLIMDPAGKLLLLEGGRDAADPQREERRLQVRERVREVSQGAKKAGDGGNGKPFGN